MKILLAYDRYCDWIDSDCTLGHLGIKALFGPKGSLRLSESNARINQKLNGKPNSCTVFQLAGKTGPKWLDFHGTFAVDSHSMLSEDQDNEIILVQTETGGVSNHCLFSGRGIVVFPVSTGSDRQNADRFFFSSLFSEDFYLCSNASIYSEWCMKRLLCLNSSEAFIWSQWKPKHLSVSQLPRRWRQKGCAVIHVLKESGRKLWRSREADAVVSRALFTRLVF